MAARTGVRRVIRPLVVVPTVVLLAVGAGGATLALRADDDGTTEAVTTTEQVVEVGVEDLQQTISSEGTIEAEATEDLSFTASGTVTEVLVAAGDTVTTGQTLARLDSSELEAAVVEAQATLDDAEATLADAEDADATDTELTARRSQVDSAQVGLEDAYEALAGAVLTSPIDGTVATVGYEVGDVLGSGGTDGTSTAGSGTGSGNATPPTASSSDTTGGATTSSTTGVQVVSTGTYTVTLALDATEVDSVEVGQTALVTPTTSSSSSGQQFGGPGGGGGFPGGGFPGGGGAAPGATSGSDDTDAEGSSTPEAAGDQVEGTVTEVGAVASADSGVATFPVVVTVEGSADEFFPGALAEVEVVYATVEDAVTVPSFAVTRADGQAVVTVADGDEREERTVTMGITSGQTVQVTDGLEAGDQVVVTVPGGGLGGDGGAGMTGGPPGLTAGQAPTGEEADG